MLCGNFFVGLQTRWIATYRRQSEPSRKLMFWKNQAMRTLFPFLAVVGATLGAAPANAHAHLDHASPQVDSTVPSAPPDITLWFTQNLEPAFSTVEVTGTDGGRVDAGKPQISGNTMRVGLKALSPGTYHVHWHALSVDTHTTEGNFSFKVGGGT